MSLYTEMRHPRAHARRVVDPAHPDGPSGFNEQLATWITTRIGSMWTVYICSAVTVIWAVLGARQVLGFDPYPYPFLLFLGNVAQLLLIFIILLGQQVLGRTADRQSMHTYEDAEAILVDCEEIQNHLMAQDTHLAAATDLRAEEQEILARAAERIEAPPTTDDAYVGFNGRLAEQTYLNAEAVLHACERLQAHLRAQDLAIRHVVESLGRRVAGDVPGLPGPGSGEPGARGNKGPLSGGRRGLDDRPVSGGCGLRINRPITA